MIGVVVMLNNYLHDVASALLLCSAVVMMVMLKYVRDKKIDEPVEFFTGLYNRLSVIALASVVWIILGGIVRTLAYRTYEWSDAAGRAQIPALVGKHVFFLILLTVGVYYWLRLRREIMALTRK
ncbi:MAG: hypothetical protein AB1546_02130 [bacterium]